MRVLLLLLLLTGCATVVPPPDPADLSPSAAATQEIEAAHPWAP